MRFQSNTIFFFQLIAGRFWFIRFVYMNLLRCFFFFTVLPSWNYEYIACMASDLNSYQIMWHNKRIHGLQSSCLRAVVVFSVFKESKLKVDTASYIISEM